MKDTGMTRRIDELGRLVIPKEIRKNLKIKNNDQFEISLLDNKIVLSKYDNLNKDRVLSLITNSLKKIIRRNVLITSRDVIVEYSLLNDEIDNYELSNNIMNIIEKRSIFEENNAILNIFGKEINASYIICPIIVNGDIYGSIIVYGDEVISNKEKSIIEFVKVFLENYLE